MNKSKLITICTLCQYQLQRPLYGDNRELKQATPLSHGRIPEGNISHTRIVVSPRFTK